MNRNLDANTLQVDLEHPRPLPDLPKNQSNCLLLQFGKGDVPTETV